MRSARVLILDLSSTGSLGNSLRSLLAGSSSPWHLEVSFVHQPTSDEVALTELFSSSIPDLVLLVLTRELNQRAGEILTLLTTKLGLSTVVAVSDAEDPEQMFDLFRQGAHEFITLPIDNLNVLPRIWRLLEHSSVEGKPRREVRTKVGLRQMLGRSQAWIEQVSKIPLVARCDANVLITGDTGTGKELCARAIHYLSLRASEPFVPVDCGAIPENLFENELFGHAKGAFTDASAAEIGLLGEADGGTLFLDEIDSITPMAQVKLLRFIQEREYRPLGSSRIRQADVRIVAATNVNLESALRSGKFRRDLYYRLNVVSVSLPPLRERREDISLLARHFLKKHALLLRRPAQDFTPAGIRLLEEYDWPGNVRELEHIVERAVVFNKTDLIDSTHLNLEPSRTSVGRESFRRAKERTVAEFEKSYIEKLLVDCEGNISKAARMAQKNRRAFWELMRKYQIAPRK